MINANLIGREEAKVVRLRRAYSQVPLRRTVDSEEEYQLLIEEIYSIARDELFDTSRGINSRFAQDHEDRIKYAAYELNTAFAEFSFYRFTLYEGFESTPTNLSLVSTVFETSSERFLDLTSAHFRNQQDRISSPTSHDFAQNLGQEMREINIHCFKYRSARVNGNGENMGIFRPRQVIRRNRRVNQEILFLAQDDATCRYLNNDGELVGEVSTAEFHV